MRRIARTLFILIASGGLAASAFGQLMGTEVRAQAPAAGRPRAKAAAPPNAAARVPNPAQEAAQRAEMEQILVAWEKQSAKLTSLVASYRRIDKSPGWDEVIEYEGNAYLKSPSYACLHLKKLTVTQPKPGQKPLPGGYVDHERIVCTGTDVLQYDYASKEIFRFPLDKQARQKALEEGPLPFLFNMKAEETKIRYSMSLTKENDDAYLIAVLPRLAEDKQVFSKAFILLNKKTFLPDRLLLLAPNGKDSQDYLFGKVETNREINDKFFQAAVKIQGWKLIDNPAPAQPVRRQPGDAPAPGAAPARGQVGARPLQPPR